MFGGWARTGGAASAWASKDSRGPARCAHNKNTLKLANETTRQTTKRRQRQQCEQVRRRMEEENRKARRAARREWVETVRELAAFVKKRD